MRGVTFVSLLTGSMRPSALDRLLDRAWLAFEDAICNVLSSTVVRDIRKGLYDDGCVVTFPCVTFESARAAIRLGSVTCGVNGLTTHEGKLVRVETLCALRCVSVATAFVSRSKALNRVVPWVWIWPSSCVILDLPAVLTLMDGAQKWTVGQYIMKGTLECSSAPFTRFTELGQIMADLFQLSARDRTGCVPDVSVLMPSTPAVQPVRTG